MRISDWSSDVCSSDLLQAWQAHSLASYIEAVSTADGLILEATNAARSERGGMRRAIRGTAPGDQAALAELAEHRATFEDRQSVVLGKSLSVRVDLGSRRITQIKI